MLLTEFNSSRHAKVIEVHEDEAGTNPMAQAVTRRIMNQHPEWLMKYGPEAVMQAIDDVTEGETDWEEIGSSDVSAYVTYVGDALRDRGGSREEMADRRPFAEEQGVAESLRDGEYHVATVTLDDGTEKKVNLMSDEGFRDQIEKHFAKQGRQVKDIKVDWGIHANESNDRPLAFVAPSKNTNLGYIKLIAHKVKNNKPVSRREKEDLSKYLASNMMKEDEHGDLRTGWIAKAAKRAFPMAGSDMEALAMWINDRLEKDVARLDKENDREDRDINRLDRENDLEQTMIDRLDQRDGNVDDRLDKIEKTLSQKSMEGSYFSTKANAEEISKYLAEMKNDGYDI